MNRRCEFVAVKKGHHATSRAQRVVGVSKSTWYRWQRAAATRSQRAADDREITRRIQESWEASERAYGAPRIYADLRDLGLSVNHKRVRRLMRQAGITSCMPFRPPRTTRPGVVPASVDDLVLRKFLAEAPNRVWVTDITYIWTEQGWLYLAAILDLHSRKVVGWATGNRCTAALALSALRCAIRSRRPAPGLIHHSDRGCQYTSRAYQRALRAAGIRPSMGHIATCYDNAVAESFWASLKKERLDQFYWPTRRRAHRAIAAYVTWYNTARRHSYLGQVAPDVFEARAA